MWVKSKQLIQIGTFLHISPRKRPLMPTATTYIALLRAVNVGGTGKLPMADLVALCTKAGFKNVRTYIASGNVLFESPLTERQAQTKLHAALEAHAGRRVDVIVRTGAEM